jgi:phage terminase large subunit-like protein
MAKQRTVTLHTNGPALWPEHKPLTEVTRLRDNTPELVWQGTYQGSPTPAGGYTYKRAWWTDNRYHMRDHWQLPWIPQAGNTRSDVVLGTYQSWDTAYKEGETDAYTAMVQGDLMADYRLRVTFAWRDRLGMDSLPDEIKARAISANLGDKPGGKLRGVVIEDKGSGISALQTLKATAPPWLRPLLVGYNPGNNDKVARGGQAAVYCRNRSVLLPHPSPEVAWLLDLEDELFTFPQSAFMDYADAFSQLVIYLEHLLAGGYMAREETPAELKAAPAQDVPEAWQPRAD